MNELSPESVRDCIGEQYLVSLDSLEIFPELESTNGYLLNQPRPAASHCRVAVAEHQTGGRGRRGRVWVSPPSTGLCLSLAYSYANVPRDIQSLSLAVGAGIAQLLERFAMRGIGVKWPNDIVANDGKVGGILSEVHTAPGAGVTVVVGVGLNVDFGADRPELEIETRLAKASDLASCCDDLPSRSELAGGVIGTLIGTMRHFKLSGFAGFQESWRRYDWLLGRPVTIATNTATNAGIAEGVDIDGALLINADGNIRRVTSGSVIFSHNPGAEP